MNTIAIEKTYPVSKEYKIANQTLTFCGIDENGKDIFSDLGIEERGRLAGSSSTGTTRTMGAGPT